MMYDELPPLHIRLLLIPVILIYFVAEICLNIILDTGDYSVLTYYFIIGDKEKYNEYYQNNIGEEK